MEIKNKLTVTRGEVGGDNGGGEDHQGTCIKDTWTKPKGGRIEGGAGGVMGRKWRQWYLNNNKKKMRTKMPQSNKFLR